MTRSGILETRSHLSQIINKVMHGNEHIILRKNVPVAKIVAIKEDLLSHAQQLIQRTKEMRHNVKSVSIDELNNWKRFGRA